ncbi:site-specific integrase [Silanimonas sp.]|uniref:tyrosine-type recombinase/integrase n=1 Tax=Silanimonas sp. TaxID=1929290 RepID=UPI0022C099B2|nr:site-specific integrase [Silanimonas sp.]MCZ8063253.1 integrase arm-type DNA-binding domain-containing protein [Silanimonas sp.]
MGELSAKKIESLKPRGRVYRVSDGQGLALEVRASGAKCWRFRFRHGGREGMLALGQWPEVSLAEARDRTIAARRSLRDGVSPAEERRERARAAELSALRTFEATAAAWLTQQCTGWAPATARKARYVVDEYLSKSLGGLDIATLSTPDARRAIAAVAARAPALAEKARGYLAGIVEFAIHAGLREEGRLLLLKGAVPRRPKGHVPAAVTPDDAGRVARAVTSYDSPVTRSALRLCMLTAQRPGNVAAARWCEFNLEAGEWLIPAERMKTRRAHLVPLSLQAVEALRDMLPFTAGREYVFPPLARQRTPHLHRDALSGALRRMGLKDEHATHGFRAMFRTLARERLGIAADVLEAQLAHSKGNAVAKAYDRAQFFNERREAVQRWADWLDALTA